jgi:hypothetical protein
MKLMACHALCVALLLATQGASALLPGGTPRAAAPARRLLAPGDFETETSRRQQPLLQWRGRWLAGWLPAPSSSCSSHRVLHASAAWATVAA